VKMNNSRYLVPLMAFLAILLLSACSASASPTPVSSPTEVKAAPTPSQTPTPAPQKTLTICLGDEPASLYMYANLGTSARSVLSAIYDGPIDSNSFAYQPVILKDLPNLENGEALLETVMVREGDRVVDSNGLPVTLTAGMSILPSGCTSDDCAVTYDGFTDIQMDQMVVTFTLLPGLTWSDGEPLTADDSVFSFEIASSTETTASRYLVDRTLSYEAIDDLTVQWWGRPGYIDPEYFTNFWTPAPRHAWKDYAVSELPTLDASARYLRHGSMAAGRIHPPG
jgi:peptide/nickel transport system substrate-binding protein